MLLAEPLPKVLFSKVINITGRLNISLVFDATKPRIPYFQLYEWHITTFFFLSLGLLLQVYRPHSVF